MWLSFFFFFSFFGSFFVKLLGFCFALLNVWDKLSLAYPTLRLTFLIVCFCFLSWFFYCRTRNLYSSSAGLGGDDNNFSLTLKNVSIPLIKICVENGSEKKRFDGFFDFDKFSVWESGCSFSSAGLVLGRYRLRLTSFSYCFKNLFFIFNLISYLNFWLFVKFDLIYEIKKENNYEIVLKLELFFFKKH